MINSLHVDLSLTEGDLTLLLLIAVCLISFIIYWFTAQSEKIREYFYGKYDSDTASTYLFLFTKIFGFVIMGLIPLSICLLVLPGFSLASCGLTFRPDTILLTFLSIAGLSLVIFSLISFTARQPKNRVKYPLIRAKVWTKKTVTITVIGWTLYLLGYELLFRGIFLLPVASQIGVWPAIFVNIAIYSATHIPKGLEETIGAIPLGLVFCLLTLATGTIWIAFAVHLVMAVTNCLTAMKYHPDIVYKQNPSDEKPVF
jgi:membrane protease YdiL (CAAX protease family)